MLETMCLVVAMQFNVLIKALDDLDVERGSIPAGIPRRQFLDGVRRRLETGMEPIPDRLDDCIREAGKEINTMPIDDPRVTTLNNEISELVAMRVLASLQLWNAEMNMIAGG